MVQNFETFNERVTVNKSPKRLLTKVTPLLKEWLSSKEFWLKDPADVFGMNLSLDGAQGLDHRNLCTRTSKCSLVQQLFLAKNPLLSSARDKVIYYKWTFLQGSTKPLFTTQNGLETSRKNFNMLLLHSTKVSMGWTSSSITICSSGLPYFLGTKYQNRENYKRP
jgi:hypothetical protein